MQGGLLSRDVARQYVTAGRAVVTLVSKKTGKRYTYRVMQHGTAARWFVAVLTGPDNTHNYTFIGTHFAADGNFKHGKKSSINASALSVRAWAWFWKHGLTADEAFAQVEVWHHGRCGACARPLTDPESIARGIGPVCAKRLS